MPHLREDTRFGVNWTQFTSTQREPRLPGGRKRSEPAHDFPQPDRLVLSTCGAIREFRDERRKRMTTPVAEAEEDSRQGHRLVSYGLCPDCERGGRK